MAVGAKIVIALESSTATAIIAAADAAAARMLSSVLYQSRESREDYRRT